MAEQKQNFIYEHAQGVFHANLSKVADQVNSISEKWNSLEVGKFGAAMIQKALNSDSQYFRDNYRALVADKVSKVSLPKSVKESLLRDSDDPKELRELLELIDQTKINFQRLSLVEMEGYTKPIPVRKEFFEIISGKIDVVENIAELTLPSFSITLDSPEKEAAIQKLEEAAAVLTELTEILVSSGLYPADQVPLVMQSKVFKFDDGAYSVRKEALV